MKYKPMRHQKLAGDFLAAHDRCCLFLGMGLGKTVVTLTNLNDRLFDEFTVRRALVIAPKNVADNVWAEECEKWDHLGLIRCSKVLGTEKQRIKALETKANLYIINRENVEWLANYFTEQKQDWPFDEVILDELSSFKSPKSKRFRALKKVIRGSRYVVGLTGTPAGNGYLDLWPEIFLVDGGERLGARIGEYRDRYFRAGAHKGHIVYEWRLRMGAKDAIDRKLSDLCLSMSAEDWLSLPEIVMNEIPVRMTPKEKKLYERLEKDRVLPLLKKSGELEPALSLDEMEAVIDGGTAAALAGKLLQMANGAVYDDTGEVYHLHDQKLEALAELLDTHEGEPILCFYSYKHDLERIRSRFPKAQTLDGPETVKDWSAGKIPLLLCHPASAGHGLNLQYGGHIIVWFGLPWSLELYQQANARLPRPGQTERVVIHHIICRGTLDERVLNVLREKDVTQSSLLRALKQYVKEEN